MTAPPNRAHSRSLNRRQIYLSVVVPHPAPEVSVLDREHGFPVAERNRSPDAESASGRAEGSACLDERADVRTAENGVDGARPGASTRAPENTSCANGFGAGFAQKQTTTYLSRYFYKTKIIEKLNGIRVALVKSEAWRAKPVLEEMGVEQMRLFTILHVMGDVLQEANL